MRKLLLTVVTVVFLLPSVVGAQATAPNPVNTASSKFNEMTVAQLQAQRWASCWRSKRGIATQHTDTS